jgi:hypothetical protein
MSTVCAEAFAALAGTLGVLELASRPTAIDSPMIAMQATTSSHRSWT